MSLFNSNSQVQRQVKIKFRGQQYILSLRPNTSSQQVLQYLRVNKLPEAFVSKILSSTEQYSEIQAQNKLVKPFQQISRNRMINSSQTFARNQGSSERMDTAQFGMADEMSMHQDFHESFSTQKMLSPKGIGLQEQASRIYQQRCLKKRKQLMSQIVSTINSSKKVPEIKIDLSKTAKNHNNFMDYYQQTMNRHKKVQEKIQRNRQEDFRQKVKYHKSKPFQFKSQRTEKAFMKPLKDIKFEEYYKDTITFQPKVIQNKFHKEVKKKVQAKDRAIGQAIEQNRQLITREKKKAETKTPFR